MRYGPILQIKVHGSIIAGLLEKVGLSLLFYIRSRVLNGRCIGDDHAILNREIDRIQELLDEQPDSKCKCLPILFSTLLYLRDSCRVHGDAGTLQAPSFAFFDGTKRSS
jgi:hypothetical protein